MLDSEIVDLWQSARAESTQTYYRQVAAEFLRIAALPLAECTIGQVQKYAQTLRDKGLANSTIAKKVAVVKSLSRFAAEIDPLMRDFAIGAKLKNPTPDFEARSIDREQVTALFSAAQNPHERAMLAALYGLAMRRSEAVRLRWTDFSVRADQRVVLRIIGKGGRLRVALVPAWVWGIFSDVPRDGDVIFGITSWRCWDWFKKLCARAGLSSEVSPHWLRHSHAVHALERGAALDTIRDSLGHANVSTTNHYLRARSRQSSGDFLDFD